MVLEAYVLIKWNRLDEQEICDLRYRLNLILKNYTPTGDRV